MTLFGNDFRIDLFSKSHSSRLDGMKHSAHTTTKFQKKIIHTCAPQKSIKYVKIVGYWYSTAKVQTVRGNNVKTTPKPSESKSDCTKSLEKEGQKSIPSNQVRQRANRRFLRFSEGAERVDPKTGWRWYRPTTSSSSSSSWWQSAEKWWQHRVGMNSELFDFCFACRQWRFRCNRRGVNPTPHLRTFRTSATREFSRVAQDWSHQVSCECLCLDKRAFFTSVTPCRTRSHCCAFT